MADKSHLRTGNGYSSEVMGVTCKNHDTVSTIDVRKTYQRLTVEEDETANM